MKKNTMIFLYKLFLSIYENAGQQERKVLKLGLEFVRRILIWLGDPPYIVEIRGKRMTLPISHKLPIFIRDAPLYDTLPARVADYLRRRNGKLIMVDVGANVGDTILACNATSEDQFLAVEANPEFIQYLKKNLDSIDNYVLVQAFCHSGSNERAHVQIESVGGTARVTEATDGLVLSKKTLDEIIDEHMEFREFTFLKLDTDGNDFDILKGAHESIVVSQPIILMESDVFGNVDYADDVLHAVNSLADAGYTEVVAYDNLGHFFCTFSANEPFAFLNAIAYQIISEFGYYDLLFLPEKYHKFVQEEKDFFLHYAEKKGLSAIIEKTLYAPAGQQ